MRKKDEEKEKSIKEAVIRLILEEGFQGTSISKIAKEAGVSPATVYIYYDNKENMLQDIYREYSEGIYNFILGKVHEDMEGTQIIEALIRSYYSYIKQHREIFNFVHQFSNCPSLSRGCSESKGISNINNFIDSMKRKHIIKNYSNDTLLAFIFYPVKAIAVNNKNTEADKERLLQEMIEIIQDTLLI